jgi:argininosuccinate lyase
MKLWQKDSETLKEVESFTIGNDRHMDMYLAQYDVMGSIAHVMMLAKVGLLKMEEAAALVAELRRIYGDISRGEFTLESGVEDVHSQVELMLTRKLGETGKKIHSARSRNDQVLVDIKLFLRGQLGELIRSINSLFELLQSQSETYKDHLLPGYTHLQLAMPSSFGLWFGAYAESLVDDMITIRAAFEIVNKNPLGSAAGYGSSFPIDRRMTTELLGFDDLNYNVVYAQMGRGKAERIVAHSLANVADTLSKLSTDACLYLNPGLGFISFPDELTTGSSIMPHKKNPDVFELVRAHCNRIKAIPNEITLLTTNLPSGYHRDMQLLKEHLFPAFRQLADCISMIKLMLSHIEIKKDILSDEKYKFLFSVEEVNRLVNEGMPFRDAYKRIGKDIEEGNFKYRTELKHTHEGSIGNLNNGEVRQQMVAVLSTFPFQKIHEAVSSLVVGN